MRTPRHCFSVGLTMATKLLPGAGTQTGQTELPGNQPLTLQGDIFQVMIARMDRFLLRESNPKT